MTLTAQELEYLAGQRLGRLATAQPDGTLQVSPVGFAWNPETGTIDIRGFTMVASRKFRNVADNGRVAFVVDDLPSTDPWRVRCLEIRGDGEAIDGPDAMIRIHPRRVIAFGLEDTDTDPHRLTVHKRDVSV
ncbi:PPOX class F420-dependent oxidoreductase [Actinoplanes subglobosus]|uniref:PPOX class F420-dependent oxidoreductase n=1 Tax=Actinoplanes subglobosus TaxID=1547892 RepID=A0ABV8JAM5_9ACTN